MNYDKLKILDFSQGIRSDEVTQNDFALQGQIERERLAIAGNGVNYGLELKLTNDFELSITNGTIVDVFGKEQFIYGGVFNIQKPKIKIKKGYVYAKNGIIKLNHTPYSINRNGPSQFDDKKNWGIDLQYSDNPYSTICISNIDKKNIYTDINDPNSKIKISYYIAYDRIDTIYINNDKEIKIISGNSSTTPSAYIPEDCLYVLGFIKIISEYYDEDSEKTLAKASIIKDFNNRRTIYTDSNNELYLCGVPFESLLKIYFEEPKNPKEGMLLYDMQNNKLKIWRRTDNFYFTDIITYNNINPDNKQIFNTSVGYKKNNIQVYIEQIETVNGEMTSIWKKLQSNELKLMIDLEDDKKNTEESKQFMIIPKLANYSKIKYVINRYDGSYYWVPINDTSFISANEYKMWAPNESGDNLVEYKNGLNIEEMNIDRPNHDLKTFIFKKDELNLRFNPNKNELNIIIDQIPLHRDQFTEITVEDILNDLSLKKIAIDNYGYTEEYLELLKTDYKEIGLGFKLVNKLDRPGFIEVNIQHRINDSMLKNKFQRNASFAKTETLIYGKDITSLNGLVNINTIIPYQYGEEQLDVYINGRLIKKELINEISNTENILGSFCKKFSFKISEVNITENDEITYKITTNIYSYDHVDSRIEDSQKELKNQIAILNKTIDILTNKVNNLEQLIIE